MNLGTAAYRISAEVYGTLIDPGFILPVIPSATSILSPGMCEPPFYSTTGALQTGIWQPEPLP